MKPTLVFATGNPNKVREVNEMLGGRYEIKSLVDIGCTEDIPETEPTLEGNAILKAMYVYDKYGLDCFSEDTGLEVFALEMQPGVHTARYAGADKNSDANMDKLIAELSDQQDRTARFRTVVACVRQGKVVTFEGICSGQIATQKSGVKGFGYDPVFIPDGETKTFAEMGKEEKNKISHRGRAIRAFLKEL